MKNGDRLRSKTNSELAHWLVDVSVCDTCKMRDEPCDGDVSSCLENTLMWLEREEDVQERDDVLGELDEVIHNSPERLPVEVMKALKDARAYIEGEKNES